MKSAGEGETVSAVIVCGLGTLGQYCASKLKEFGTAVTAIELAPKNDWELAHVPGLLDGFVTGDCREPRVLQEAGIDSARAVLVVTHDERVNIATAFAVRALNPRIRIVIRSAQERLNDLLGSHLGDFVAFEPTRLSAAAFALAGLGDQTLGLFTLEGRSVRVTRHDIAAAHRWCGRTLSDLNTHQARVLTTATAPASDGLCAWEPETIVGPGDRITYLELDRGFEPADAPAARRDDAQKARLTPATAATALRTAWSQASQTLRVAVASLLVLGTIYTVGVALYKQHYHDITLHDALNVSMVLIIGGYDNLFGSLKLPFPIPGWLHVFSILETIAGTVFIGIVYAFFTERVLSARFQFRRRRPGMPRAGHVVIVGLGRVGTQVATLLSGLKMPVAAADRADIDPSTLPAMPFVRASGLAALDKMNVATAASVMALTNDEVANLELALLARSHNERCTLVIRTDDPHFSENVTRLVPHARALGVHDLAAEAFAAAAFGETILSLMRIDGQTTLLTEYRVEPRDTLEGRLLADLVYGYGVLPVLYESGDDREFLPREELRLKLGDRLIVLATIDALQRVEQGETREPAWFVRVERTLSKDASFEGAMAIARSSGCSVEAARAVMSSLPAFFDHPLYKQQAQRLVRALSRAQVEARLVPARELVH